MLYTMRGREANKGQRAVALRVFFGSVGIHPRMSGANQHGEQHKLRDKNEVHHGFSLSASAGNAAGASVGVGKCNAAAVPLTSRGFNIG